jgi:hypothetical protein
VKKIVHKLDLNIKSTYLCRNKNENAMKTIEKISLQKRNVNWTSTQFNTRMCFLTNGASATVESLLIYIGNENLDNWTNVERIRKSTSNKNIQNYLTQFINQIIIID